MGKGYVGGSLRRSSRIGRGRRICADISQYSGEDVGDMRTSIRLCDMIAVVREDAMKSAVALQLH